MPDQSGAPIPRAMMVPRLRVVLFAALVASGAALLIALGSEYWGGLVPCALCLVERWPYRIAIALSAIGLVLPRHLARLALGLVIVTSLAAAAVAAVHVGVEQDWWPSPLPECAVPRLAQGSIAERLASMPVTPSKACEDPTYLIPAIPISMAQLNLIYALALSFALATFMWRTRRSGP